MTREQMLAWLALEGWTYLAGEVKRLGAPRNYFAGFVRGHMMVYMYSNGIKVLTWPRVTASWLAEVTPAPATYTLPDERLAAIVNRIQEDDDDT